VYSTRIHVYTRASLTDIPSRKIARVGQVGEDPRACSAGEERSYSCGKLNREVAGHADILATILARKSARMSVSVPWNAGLTRSTKTHRRIACVVNWRLGGPQSVCSAALTRRVDCRRALVRPVITYYTWYVPQRCQPDTGQCLPVNILCTVLPRTNSQPASHPITAAASRNTLRILARHFQR